MARFKSAGQGATLWVVLIFFGVLVIVGILAWLGRTPHPQPTNPENPRPTARWRVPFPNSSARRG